MDNTKEKIINITAFVESEKEPRKSNFERYYRALKAIGKKPFATRNSSSNKDDIILAFKSSSKSAFLDIAKLTLELEEYDDYVLSHILCVYGDIVVFSSIPFNTTEASRIDAELEQEETKKKSELLFSLIGGEDSKLAINTLEYLYDEDTRLNALNLYYYLQNKSLPIIEAIVEFINALEAE